MLHVRNQEEEERAILYLRLKKHVLKLRQIYGFILSIHSQVNSYSMKAPISDASEDTSLQHALESSISIYPQ